MKQHRPHVLVGKSKHSIIGLSKLSVKTAQTETAFSFDEFVKNFTNTIKCMQLLWPKSLGLWQAVLHAMKTVRVYPPWGRGTAGQC